MKIKAQLEKVGKRKFTQDYVVSFSLPEEFKKEASYLFDNTDQFFEISLIQNEDVSFGVLMINEEPKNDHIDMYIQNEIKNKEVSEDLKKKSYLRGLHAIMNEKSEKTNGTAKDFKALIKRKYGIVHMSELDSECLQAIIGRLEKPQIISDQYVAQIISNFYKKQNENKKIQNTL